MGKHLQTKIKYDGRTAPVFQQNSAGKPADCFLLTLWPAPGVRAGDRTCFFVPKQYSIQRPCCQEKFLRLEPGGAELLYWERLKINIIERRKREYRKLCTLSTEFSTLLWKDSGHIQKFLK